MNRGLWYASLVLIILGLISLIVGVIMTQYDNDREQLKGRVTARVIELVHREIEGPYRNRYYPVFEFYAKGRLYKLTYPYGSYPCRFRIGQEVRLRYDLEEPSTYRIVHFSLRAILPQALTIAGVGMLVLAVFIFIRFATRG